jgi:hypothetical protein
MCILYNIKTNKQQENKQQENKQQENKQQENKSIYVSNKPE